MNFLYSRETIKKSDLDAALREVNFHGRICRVITLYVGAIEVLAGRDPKPNVILCCIPQEVIDLCTVMTTRSGEMKRRRVSKAEKNALESVASGQGFLFREMDPTLSIEDEEGEYQNLRRGIKAEVMQFEIPTQLVWPRTLRLTDDDAKPGETASQDVVPRPSPQGHTH